MSSWLFFKVFGDACLYFSVIGAFPMLFPCRYAFYLPALLCAMGAMIASLLKKLHPTMRILGCLLPICALFLASNIIEHIVLLPIIAYCLAVIVRSNCQLEYDQFLPFFKKLIKLWLCFFFVVLLISSLLNELGESLDFGIDTLLRYGILCFISGILLLRALRLGNLTSQNTNRKQMIVTAGGVGAFMLLAVLAERILMQHGRTVADAVVSILKFLFSLPILLIMSIANLLFNGENKGSIETTMIEVVTTTEEAETVALPKGGESTPSVLEQLNEENFPWWIVVVMIAVLTAILFFAFRLHQRKEAKARTYEDSQKLAKSKKAKTAADSNRAKLRRYYRDFLKYEKTKGLKLSTDQTSLDILENLPHKNNHQACAKLRELYLSARYDDTHDVSKQQLDEAQSAWKDIRK